MYYFDEVDNIIQWRTLSDGSWTLDRVDYPVMIYKPMLIDYLLRPSQVLTRLRCRISKPLSGEVVSAKKTSEILANKYDRRALNRSARHWYTSARTVRSLPSGYELAGLHPNAS